MKQFWLFQAAPGNLPRGKKTVFWCWNALLVLASGVCLGALSLIFAFGHYDAQLFRSYFTHPLILLLNVLPVILLELLLWLLFSRSWLAFFLTGVVTLGVSIGHYFKLLFRDDPLMFQDLKYLREAEAITQTAKYDLTPDKRVIAAVVCLLLGTVVLFFLARGLIRLRIRLMLAAVLILACLPLRKTYESNQIYNVSTQNYDYINRWAATQQYISRGFVYPFLHSVYSGAAKPPEGYDEETAKALLAPYEDADIPADKQVDLITLQLEAFSDFSRLGDIPGVDWDAAYATYHTLEAESYTGDLITNIFAGGTVNTERSFLTGYLDLENFRTATNSYAWYFQDQGYTVEGSHPCYQWFYNRRNVNGYLGLSTYYFLENRYQDLAGGIAPDEVLLPDIFNLYAANRDGEGKPLFSFNVTYQGHGPYDTEKVLRGQHYTDGRYSTVTTNILDNYLASVADTAENLKDLMDQFRQEDRPVVLVVFGDHKPWLGDGNSAYQELGVDLDNATETGARNYYGTRYLIWANEAAKEVLGNDFAGEGPDVSSCFLMNEVFSLCGWQGSAYLQAMEDIRQTLPVATTVGWYDEGNGLTRELSETGRLALEKLRFMEYYDSRHFRY